MLTEIDRVGVFRGKVIEHGVGATTNGFPQFTVRCQATERFVDSKEEMENLGLTEPGWVDWSPYEAQATGYLVMFGKNKQIEGAMKPTFHVEAIQKALGWDGTSFATLGAGDYSDRTITFWVEENDYNGNVTLRVNAIDAGDASPNRTLRTLDAAGLKDLDAKFAGVLQTKKAAPVKAASAPAKAAPAKPAATPAAKTAAPVTKPAATPAAPKAPPATKKPAPSSPPAEVLTYGGVWDATLKNRGDASEDAVAEKWVSACDELAPGKDETTITAEELVGLNKAMIAAFKK